MDAEKILSMDVIKRIDLYQSLNAEDNLRWHVLFDCTCSVPVCYFEYPAEHTTYCPMHNPNNPNYDYM